MSDSIRAAVPASVTAQDLPTRCARWLALGQRIDRLSLRWAKLEARLAREQDWFNLNQDQREALPQAAVLSRIEQRLEALSQDYRLQLEQLVDLPAIDLRGVAAKLSVAAYALSHERDSVSRLVEDAARELGELLQ